MTDTSDKNRLLAREIHGIFSRGIRLGPDVCRYMDAVFTAPSAEELLVILNDVSDPDRDSLVELIFFPDPAHQIQLEPLLQRHDYEDSDGPKVLEALMAEAPQALLIFEDGRGRIQIPVPRDECGQFIARLNISQLIPEPLVEAISQNVAPEDQDRMKVRLRNARFTPSGAQTDFLVRFFRHIVADTEQLLEYLDLLLEILRDLPEDADIFAGLMARKRFYFKSIRQGEKLAEYLEKENIETLIAQGFRIPHIDIADARHKMAMLDRIGYAIFGKSEYMDPGGGAPESGEYGAEELRRLMDSYNRF